MVASTGLTDTEPQLPMCQLNADVADKSATAGYIIRSDDEYWDDVRFLRLI